MDPDGDANATTPDSADDCDERKPAYRIDLWHLNGNLIQTFREDEPIHTLSFSPDGRRLASAGWDETIRLRALDKEDAPLLKLTGH